MSDLVIFSISGTAMGEIVDSDLYDNPSPRDHRASLALRTAIAQRTGKSGLVFMLRCDRAAAEIIRSFCEAHGRALLDGSDRATRKRGRALIVAEDRIAQALIRL